VPKKRQRSGAERLTKTTVFRRKGRAADGHGKHERDERSNGRGWIFYLAQIRYLQVKTLFRRMLLVVGLWPSVASVTACGADGIAGIPATTKGAGGDDGHAGGDGGSAVSGGDGVGGAGGSAVTGGSGGGWTEAKPARYPHDALLSPISEYVATAMRNIAKASSSPDPRVFMKVGASGTVSKNLLYCFAGNSQPQYSIELDGRDELQATIDYFRLGDAAGTTPFDRPTLAAKVGRTAKWVIGGSPSPLQQEIATINPRIALVNYGTNDMQMGVTHRSAMWPFFENFSKLLDELVQQGIVPIITGLNPRSDSVSGGQWVPTYNALVRGIAEARQLPFIHLYQATFGLPQMGLVSDGLHGNVYTSGGPQPCVFDATALQSNYNIRNLLTLQALAAVWPLLADAQAKAPDAETAQLKGLGSLSDPYVIEQLPFTHAGDTAASPNQALDSYPGCNADQDESGGEYIYRFELKKTTAVRIFVLDRSGVDIDVHLLDSSATAAGCIERDDRIIERSLPAGVYHLAIDSFVSSGAAKEGPYQLVMVACEAGDPDC
jgi:hypothetical protein